MRFQGLYSPATSNWRGKRGFVEVSKVGRRLLTPQRESLYMWVICSNNSLSLEFNTSVQAK